MRKKKRNSRIYCKRLNQKQKKMANTQGKNHKNKRKKQWQVRFLESTCTGWNCCEKKRFLFLLFFVSLWITEICVIFFSALCSINTWTRLMQYNFITLWNSKMMNVHQFEANLSIESVVSDSTSRKRKRFDHQFRFREIEINAYFTFYNQKNERKKIRKKFRKYSQKCVSEK